MRRSRTCHRGRRGHAALLACAHGRLRDLYLGRSVPGQWYEMRSIDRSTSKTGRYTGVRLDDDSASFEVDGRAPSQRFLKKNYSASRAENPYS